MYTFGKVVLIAAGLIMILAAGALAQAPNTLMYQGKLTNAVGPISDPVNVTFRIYDLDVGGVELWMETQSVDPNELGVFTAELGTSTAFGPGVFDGSVRYLGIEVAGDGEMVPRQPITSVPYAMKSNTPGVANYEREFFYFYTGAGSFTIDSIDITIPGPGYVVVTAGGYPNSFTPAGIDTELRYLISKTFGDANFTANPGVLIFRVPGAYPGNWSCPVQVSRLYEEPAGTHRYYFNTGLIGASFPNMGKIYMRAVYYPTAYGAIDNLPLLTTSAASRLNPLGVDEGN